MAENIEDTIFDSGMAVNCVAAANRLIEIMTELKTNNLKTCKDDVRVQRLMWFLNSFVYGQIAIIDMYEEWNRMYGEWERTKK